VNYWKLFQKLLDDNANFSVVADLLAFWYSNQFSRIRWKSVLSDAFTVLLDIFVMIFEISDCNVGCYSMVVTLGAFFAIF